MEQEKIKYKDVMNLGFNEQKCYDSVYEAEYGFQFCIISKDLTDTISLDWAKETQLCKMIRVKDKESGDIASEMPIKNLDHLKEIINFFTNK
jgi:hypothetical protein